MTRMKNVYPSAIDWWLAVLLVGVPILMLILGITALASSEPGGGVLLGSGFVVAAIMGLMVYPCRYTLTDQALLIRSGVFTQRVEYRRMQSVQPTRNPLSAPALSLKRLKIKLDRGFLLISPVNREAFLEEIRRRIERARPGG